MIEKSVHTDVYKSIVARIRQARLQAGLSQEQVAERVAPTTGLAPAEAVRQRQQTQRLVSRWELGETRLDVLQLWTLCQAIGVPFLELMRDLDAELRSTTSARSTPSIGDEQKSSRPTKRKVR